MRRFKTCFKVCVVGACLAISLVGCGGKDSSDSEDTKKTTQEDVVQDEDTEEEETEEEKTEEEDVDDEETTEKATEKKQDYSKVAGTYYTKGGDTLKIKKDGTAVINIVKLTKINLKCGEIEDGVLNLTAQDPNGETLKFTFNTSKKLFKVTSSSWEYLEKGTKFDFSAKKASANSQATTEKTTEKTEKTNYGMIAGTYYAEDGSKFVLKKDGTGTISITGLTQFSCTLGDITNSKLAITAKDPDKKNIEFEFNLDSNKLSVVTSSWKLLKKGTVFQLSTEKPSQATTEKTEKTNYGMIAGTYYAEDGSKFVLKKDGTGTISIVGLTQFSCTLGDITNSKLAITAKDPDKKKMEFEFNLDSNKLSVVTSSWSLLKKGTVFQLSTEKPSQATTEKKTEEANNNEVFANVAGTYKGDGVTLSIKASGAATVSITGLSKISCQCDSITKGNLSITGEDQNGGTLAFSFNIDSKELEVVISSWELLPSGTKYTLK